MEDNNKKVSISQEDLVVFILEKTGEKPTWAEKMWKDMNKEERNEYKNTRKKLEKEQNSDVTAEDYIAQVKEEVNSDPEQEVNRLTEEQLLTPLRYTAKKAMEALPTDEENEELVKKNKEVEVIESYIKHHKISDQQLLNYAIEHDEKFKKFLASSGRLDSMYTGKHIGQIEKEKQAISKEFEDQQGKNKPKKKDKKRELVKKNNSNKFEDSKKKLDIEKFRNKKLEKQGFMLCEYLKKNGEADMRYVKMNEVGQIKVDGYVYHERDCFYRMGKKNDPVLIIFEGSLVPLTKETLNQNLGFETAEAQKLVIKGIEQAEVVKAGGLEDKLKNKMAPPKWLIGVAIAIIIGIYAFMGGFS